MKRLFIVLLIAFVLINPFALADNSTNNISRDTAEIVSNTNTTDVEIVDDETPGEEEPLVISNIVNESEEESNKTIGIKVTSVNKSRDIAELKQKIKKKKQEFQAKISEIKAEKVEIIENHNRIRLAVHSLLDMEFLAPGIGSNISVIAKEINHTINKTEMLEEKIKSRHYVWRMLVGGDEENAEKIKTHVLNNMDRIRKLKRLRNQTNVTEDVDAVLEEQISEMEEEQERLSQIAEEEIEYKGFFGWLWRK